MKHAVRAVIAVALGAGLAAAAQAQSTSQPQSTAPGTQMQSTAPSSTMQSTAPTSTMESTAPQKQRHANAHKLSKGQKHIRQVQLRLKSEGLLRGKLTGKMDRQTRIALTREQQNGLARSGSSMQRTAHLSRRHNAKSQTTGVGSSMPNAKSTAGTTTNPAPAGAGGTTSTAPSTTTTTQPSTSPAKK